MHANCHDFGDLRIKPGIQLIVATLFAALVLLPHLDSGVEGAFTTLPSIRVSSRGTLFGSTGTEIIKPKCNATENFERDQIQSHKLTTQSIRVKHMMHHHPRIDDAPNPSSLPSLERRQVLQSAAYLGLLQPLMPCMEALADERAPLPRGKVFEIEDPNTFSAVVYIPPAKDSDKKVQKLESYPLLVVLHGKGNNEHSALYEFTQPGSSSTSTLPGDHTNLPPYLLSTSQAPSSLSENFVVVAPYAGRGNGSLYDESRGKVLSFVKWFNAWIESQTLEGSGSVAINRQRVSLFGFSEGSTLAVELATTRQFNGVVVCSYGFTGTLPKMAVERLQGIPIWVFHSKGDDVYDIKLSNQLVESLIAYEGGLDVFSVGDTVKFTKLVPRQKDNGGGKVSGFEHVRAALVASKSDEVFAWLLSLQ